MSEASGPPPVLRAWLSSGPVCMSNKCRKECLFGTPRDCFRRRSEPDCAGVVETVDDAFNIQDGLLRCPHKNKTNAAVRFRSAFVVAAHAAATCCKRRGHASMSQALHVHTCSRAARSSACSPWSLAVYLTFDKKTESTGQLRRDYCR